MKRAQRPAPAAALARDSLRCAAAAAAVVITVAGVVRLTGLAAETRRMLGFGFGGVDPSPGETLRITLHNARLAAGILTCAAVAAQLARSARRLVDLVLTVVLMVNAGAVGVAVGAYGGCAIAATALHLPLELTALSMAGGAYLQACKRPLGGRTVAAIAATSGALLLAAAALETYAPIGVTR